MKEDTIEVWVWDDPQNATEGYTKVPGLRPGVSFEWAGTKSIAGETAHILKLTGDVKDIAKTLLDINMFHNIDADSGDFEYWRV